MLLSGGQLLWLNIFDLEIIFSSIIFHCIRMRTLAIQNKQYNVVSNVKCFYTNLVFKTWKKVAVYEDNRERKVFYINTVTNCSLFNISMGLLFSLTAHISWNGSLHITLHIYYMMMRETEMKIDSPKNKKILLRTNVLPSASRLAIFRLSELI